MKRSEIPLSRLSLPVFGSWSEEWFLLTCGDHAAGRFNTMTVGWGAIGCMWKRPMALVVVRPQRHTYQFMEEYADFTLCHFPSGHGETLSYCGSHSGRDVDKVKQCGLTPLACETVRSPAFDEADLILECVKTYFDDFDPKQFLAPFIEENYPNRDYHRLYLGEIRAASGIARYGA